MSLGLAIATIVCTSWVGAQPCPPDRNGDSHPLFGVLAQHPARDSEIPFANKATGIAFGDLDGDADLDVVTAMGVSNGHVGVLFNDGDGVLSRAVLYQTPAEATSPVLADFDGDGDLDCAVAIASDDSIWIFINDGAGNFTVGEPMPAGDEPRSLVAEDFDGDGLADLAVLNTTSADITILLNRGNAIFDLSATIPVPDLTPRGEPNPTFPIPGPFFDAGDIDGDGDLDLAIPATRSVRLLINDGEGGFVLAPDDLGSVQPLVYALEFGDLDGDGDPDLAGTVFCRCSRLVVWINEGGEFGEPAIYESGFNGILYANTSIALGDIDQDGDLDAALASQYHQIQFLHRNNGDGTFAPVEEHRIERGPWVVDLEDMNADGLVDFVGTLGDFAIGPLVVTKLSDGEGGFFTSEGLEPDEKRHANYDAMDVGDLDLDGDVDIVLFNTAATTPNQVRIMDNDGSGLYQQVFAFSIGPQAVPWITDIALADLDQNGFLDVVVAVIDDRQRFDLPGSLFVAFGRGDSTFEDPVRYPLAGTRPASIAILDIDGDGDLDLSVVVVEVLGEPGDLLDRRVHFMINDGAGGFSSSYQLLIHRNPGNGTLGGIAPVDIDLDGDLDLLVSVGQFREPSTLYTVVNDGTGVFEIGQAIVLTMNGHTVGVGDFDADGYPDAAIAHWVETLGGPYLTILSNDGSGHLAISETHHEPNIRLSRTILIDDVNADGAPDIFVAPDTGGAVVHLNDGHGSFTNLAWYHTHSAMTDMALFDLDDDGDKDLIGAGFQGGLDPLFVLRQVGCNCRADLSGDGELSPEDFFLYLELFAQGDDRADITGDGTLDSDDFFGFLDLYAQGCEG